MSSSTKEQFYIGTILSSLFGLLIFALLTGIGIRLIPKRVGWAATILFGTMCIVTVFNLIRECSLEQDQIPDVKSQLSTRRALIGIGVTLAALFLGFADHFISVLFTDTFPRPGVWFGTFVTTLAFYPLRDPNEKYLDLKTWAIGSAIIGVFSVALSYAKDWLEFALL